MRSFYILVTAICLLSGCTSKKEITRIPEVASGRIERIENFGSQWISARNVDIWLPDGYDRGGSHAVLYMHDGQMLFDSTLTWNQQEWGVDEAVGRLIENGVIDPCIVVGVWNSGRSRHSDYLPQKPFESLPQAYRDSLAGVQPQQDTDLFSTKVQSDHYLRFLVEELKPYIDQHYTTKAGMEHTFIAGSSMGGLISLYAICEYPQVFGGAACISTHWIGIFEAENNPIPGAIMDYIRQHLPDPSTHKLYFDYGTETLDAVYEPFQIQVDRIIESRGYTDANWKTLKFTGDDHSETSWRKRFDIPITFLLIKRDG